MAESLPASATLLRAVELGQLAYWQGAFDSSDGLASTGLMARLGEKAGDNALSLAQLSARLHDNDQPAWNIWLATCQTGSTRPLLTVRLRHAQGAWRWFRLTADLAAHAAEHMPSLLIVFEERSEQRAVETALRDSQMRYRALYDLAPIAVIITERRSTITEWNLHAQSIFGWTRQEAVGRTLLELLLPEDLRTNFSTRLKVALADDEQTAGLLQECVTRTGLPVICQWQSVRMTSTVGLTHGLLTLIQDVTAAQIAQQELTTYRDHLEQEVKERTQSLAQQTIELQSEYEERRQAQKESWLAGLLLAQIIDGLPVPVFVLDAEHRITHWNRACEVTVGVAATEMIGSTESWRPFYDAARPVIADLMLDHDNDAIKHYYGHLMTESKLVAGAYEAENYFPKMGRWLSFTASALTDDEGRNIGAVEILQDITDRKRAETALYEAKNIAETAAEAKGSFLANMSHEIRTPMNAILGLARILIKTATEGQQRDYLQRILDAGGLLLGLLNDVLDLSKIEAGRMSIENIAFCLDEVLDTASSMILSRVHEKHLELQVSIAPDVPFDLRGDPLRLSQILVNLLSNAVKFTEQGFISVHVRSERRTTDTLMLYIDVQDSGIGLSAEQAGKLFGAFVQADTSTTRRYGGTGLGLVISKKLCEAMGGEISLSSEPGQGSTFSFSANLGFVDAPPLGTTPLPATLAGAQVLVVDDQALARTLLAELLRSLGMTVDIAESGAQALEMLSGDKVYRLLFTDWRMPEMDGAELLQRMRQQLPASAQPRCILVSASSPEEIMALTQQTPVDGILHKPLFRARLIRLLAGLYGTLQVPLPTVKEAPLFTGRRVILADDVPDNQLIAIESLSEFGLLVDTADNGRQVLDLLRTGQHYDAILMDVQMPEMDGLEATRQLRGDPSYATLPVIALTAHSSSEEQDRCLHAGMNDFLTKPFTTEALRRMLARWIEPGTGQAAVIEQAVPIALPTADQMPNLPGIDTAIGLPYMNNKATFYEKMLCAFPLRFSESAAHTRALVADGKQTEAQRTAHTLKGAAGAIGAVRLQSAASVVDQLLRTNDADCGKALDELDAAMHEVLESIAAAYGANA